MTTQTLVPSSPKTIQRIEEPKTSESGAGGKNIAYLERLDHLRFLAAVMIIFHHAIPAWIVAIHHTFDYAVIYSLGDTFGKVASVCNGLVFEGHSAVALFMTLSGFLFARISDGKEIQYRGFLLNRVLRIYPLFMCAIFLSMYLIPKDNGVVALLTSMACLQNTPGAVTHPLLTAHLWSIGVEFQFYLLFPLLLIFYRKQGFRFLALLLGLSILIKATIYGSTHQVRELAYNSLFGRMDQFLIGMMLGFQFPRLQKYLKHPLLLVTAAVAVVSGLFYFHLKGGFFHSESKAIWIIWPTLEALLWGGLIATYCSSSIRIPSAISRALAFLGTLSFSLYVNHYYLANVIPKWLTPWLEAEAAGHGVFKRLARLIIRLDFWSCLILTAVVIVPAVIVLSIFTFYVIEKPFMDRRVKYTSLKQQPE